MKQSNVRGEHVKGSWQMDTDEFEPMTSLAQDELHTRTQRHFLSSKLVRMISKLWENTTMKFGQTVVPVRTHK